MIAMLQNASTGRRGRRRIDEGPALDRDRLVAALMRLGETQGIQALNMRSVARELGVSTRLLYHHVRDKAEMIELLADEVTGLAMPDLRHGSWETRLRDVAVKARMVYARFPGIPAAILATSLQPLDRPNARYIRNGVMTALADAGLDTRQADIAFVQFATTVMGSLVLHENLTRGAGATSIAPARVEEGIDLALDLLIFGIRRLAEGTAVLPEKVNTGR